MNRIEIKLRSLARKAGLHHWIWKMRKKFQPNRDYEKQCRQVLEEAVRPGDVVWDIGANEGFFTELFCKWVGPKGHVVAIEPNPEAMEITRRRLESFEHTSFENLALSSRAETAVLSVTVGTTVGFLHDDPNVYHSAGKQKQMEVQVTTGDRLHDRLGKTPNVLKIDVEGFEEDVLIGLEKTLSSTSVRVVLTEVHFQLLESQGKAMAPVRIERSLKQKGYVLRWIDRNHLLARRPG
jgi:FkbM family methyltransferase